jgi:hypothetical protein
MYYSSKRGYLNIILVVIIFLSVIGLCSWISYNIGRTIASGDENYLAQAKKVIVEGVSVPLTTISLSQNAKLQKTTGEAKIGSIEGKAEIDIFLEPGASLPEGSVLGAWLVDAGNLGGIGTTSVSENDQKYGTPLANLDFSKNLDDTPFVTYLGKLQWNSERGSYYLFYETYDILTPYDAVMITVESDGNSGNYDPRPGTPIMIGEIK